MGPCLTCLCSSTRQLAASRAAMVSAPTRCPLRCALLGLRGVMSASASSVRCVHSAWAQPHDLRHLASCVHAHQSAPPEQSAPCAPSLARLYFFRALFSAGQV